MRPDRSPLKDKPLRLPGQSLEEERRKLLDDQFDTPAYLALCLCVVAGLEWWRDITGMPPSPGLCTAAAAVAVAVAAWRLRRLRPRLKALRQGAEGERAVGQFLERLREDGYHVFHDVVGPGFNVDHVLIGSAGIYSVETKTWSKPARGSPTIEFDGERLHAVGGEARTEPIVQARAQAAWLKRLLAESAGRDVDVFPIVLFPGWFIQQSNGSLQKQWMLEPKALPAFLRRRPANLGPEDARLLAFHLSRYIRGIERDNA